MLRPTFTTGFTFPDYDSLAAAPDGLWDGLRDAATHAERAGFDAIFLMDHFQHSGQPGLEGHGILEGPTTLAALAVSTGLHLGLMTAGVTYRNPALLAKATTTIDVLSGGRAVLGIGAGWLEAEHVAYGFDYPALRGRFERLEDALRISRAMFTGSPATVDGTHHRIEEALNRPGPIRGDVPILVGGNGERRTLRLVARHADACNVIAVDAAEAGRLMGVLDRHCETVGRDPAEVWRTYEETVVIAGTVEAARAKWERWRAEAGEPADFDTALVGDVDEVAAQHAERRAAGLDAIVANLPDVEDPEVVALAGRALTLR